MNMQDLLPEFRIPQGDPKVSYEIAMAFSELLAKLNKKLTSSREKSLVITKLQEAHFFAQLAPIYTSGEG